MLHEFSVKSIVGCVLAFGMVLAVSAPQLAQAQGGGTGGAERSALPMFFDVNWTQPASQDGQTKVVQENIGDSNLELMQYGLHESCLLTSGVAGSETRPFSVWSGECESPFATTFRHKTNYVDLTGEAKIRWAVKTSGFHEVRPVVKLADGTMLVGDTAAASVPMLLRSEVPVAAIRWVALDPERVVTMGRRGGAFSAIWVPEPDLSRVDEVGFVDLMPALALALQLPGADLAPTGTLRATFIADNPVQGRVDPQTGAVSGPAPDLARELARRLGVPLALTPLPSAGAVLESVRTGEADIGFLAYQVSRAELVDYSDPYLLFGSAYAVRADSSIRRTAEVDRAGVTVGAVTGQSQTIWVDEHITSARIHALPAVPPNAALAAMLLDGTVDAFAANRSRMEALSRDFPAIRVLDDNFMVVGQAIVVAQGERERLDVLNPFLADVRTSGFVQASIDAANIPAVEVAPEP